MSDKSLCSVRSGNLGSPRAGVYPGAGRSVILVIHESVQTNMENQYADRNNFLSGLKVRDEGARTC